MIDFSNANNWELVYSERFVGESIGNRYFLPIPFVKIPVQIDSRIICTQVTSPDIPSWWRFAGWLKRKIQTGILVGGIPDASLSQRKLWLDDLQITMFATSDITYSLEIEPAKWLREINFKLWTYSGSDSSAIEDKLEEIIQLVS